MKPVHCWAGGICCPAYTGNMPDDGGVFTAHHCLKAMISFPIAIAIMAGLVLGGYGCWQGEAYLCCCWQQRFIVCPIFLPGQRAFMLISLAIIISASDIGAYFSGRIIGGPNLLLPLASKHGRVRLAVFCLPSSQQRQHSMVSGRCFERCSWCAGCGLAILSQMGDFMKAP